MAYYSQVHLVLKPSEENVKNNGEATPTTPRTWRTIIDYKNSISVLPHTTLTLPNISQMISRIGSKRPNTLINV